MSKKTWITGLTILVTLVLGFSVGKYSERAHWTSAFLPAQATSTTIFGQVFGLGQTPPDKFFSQDVDFKQFWDVWQLLKRKYYQQPVEDQTLFYGALNGLAASFGDPYTTFFDPKSADEFQQSLDGKFEGIGAEIGLKQQALQIITVLPETPAERAGLMAGDIIVKIADQDTSGMSVDKAVSLIRGPKNTKITLNIFRPAQKKPSFDVTIVRQEIHVKSVKWKMLPSAIGYIQVTNFNDDTSILFDQAVQGVVRQSPKGIILDLRSDPGGFLDRALHVAGAWMGNEVVVKERRQGKIVDILHGNGRPWLASIPTIVLVNQDSASAAEIVAGALQDSQQATILGMKTFGKGSVQDYQNFSDGSGIKITVAEWITPHERTINKVGLDPDILVDRSPEDYAANRDPQLDRAVAILNGSATSSASGATTSTKP